MPNSTRRQLLQTAALGVTVIAASATRVDSASAATSIAKLPVLRPPRLKAGDTIGLVSPSKARYEREAFAIGIENLQALGFKVKEGQFLRARDGRFAGTDVQRAGDINAMFADPTVNGIVCMTGGSGATRMLNLLDYELIRKHPKCIVGYSDITAVLNAIQAKTGLVGFHGPMAASDWNAFSLDYFRRVLIDAEAVQFKNSTDREGQLTQVKNRIQTIRAGRARGRLLGGNLTVLCSLMGTSYLPDFRGAILMIEEVHESIYRIDRMLAQLRLAGILQELSGVVLGQFADCKLDDSYGELPLEDTFDDYFKPLKVPVYAGAMFGHIPQQFTLPVGMDVEIDADAGTINLLQPAVT
jgi:muramoyltetrapeptide carboxypeptidase